MDDSRLISYTPFVPHAFAAVERALPTGALTEAMYANTVTRYERVNSYALDRLVYCVDGLAVTGVLARPSAWREEGHPILLFNRGGSGDYGMLVLPVIQRYMGSFAEQGYLVFASNYRGNDGGEGQEEFGGADVNDVLTLLDIARHHPHWDGKNIFMLGGSRGGMMTYLAIQQGAKLNAAATFGAVSDALALADARPDMEQKVYARRIPGYAQDREAALTLRSARCWPQALVSVPLLLMHGDADETVPASQMQALDEALAPLHPHYKTVLYPGGNHSLSTHAKAMLEEVTAWFERFTR